ncbi:MAG TPA: transglycosylase domain-containing protein [Solirubrobacteraceae bacterium]|nr:transglycosylase domain-containing protein [Solirubrobacteraceae bacterium]
MSRRERQRRRRRNRGSSLKRFFALTVVLVAGASAVGLIALAGWVINVADSAPPLASLKMFQPGSPSEVFAADGTPLGYIYSPDVHYAVSSGQIPEVVKQATIAIEDRRFYQHGALDYVGILRAAIKDALSGGSQLQGASTLTMQLIDNLYLQSLRRTRDIRYKIIQAKLAMELYAAHTKSWILTGYLNNVPYGTVGGQTAYGVQAASYLFFDKPVWRLDLAQAALLAGLPQAPSLYNPFIDPAAARARRQEVLQAMATAHYITQAQAARAEREPLQVRPDDSFLVRRDPYVFDFIEQQAAQDLCPSHPGNCPVLSDGLKIYSTIDLRKEAIAEQAIRNHEALLAVQAPGHGSAAAGLASIDVSNGHILALANSSSYSQTTFDYATQAHRQPGSSFKVFALMTLIHDFDGNPNTTLYVSKFLPAGWLPVDPTWSVHTAELTYLGTINVTEATIVSDNTVYAQLAADLGWSRLDATAHAMGVTSPLDGNPAEVIGGLSYGVTPLEMADAYATLANGGVHIPPTIINRIVFPDGSVRYFGNPPRTRVFPYNQAYEGTSVLKQVITSGTGTPANYGCPAAGKTGTAENGDNAWFVGYTPRMSTAVWVGYPQGNIPMVDGFGASLAAPIWHDYMQAASGGYCGDWPAPAVPFVGTQFLGDVYHYAVAAAPTPPPSAGRHQRSASGAGNGGATLGGTPAGAGQGQGGPAGTGAGSGAGGTTSPGAGGTGAGGTGAGGTGPAPPGAGASPPPAGGAGAASGTGATGAAAGAGG